MRPGAKLKNTHLCFQFLNSKSHFKKRVEPPGPIGTISHPLCSLVGSRIHPQNGHRDNFTSHFWRPSRYEIISHPWIRSEDCLYSPFQLYDASLGGSAVENGSKIHL